MVQVRYPAGHLAAPSWPAPAAIKVCRCRGCVLRSHPVMGSESLEVIPHSTRAEHGSHIP